mgnify:CR=1 FL=1
MNVSSIGSGASYGVVPTRRPPGPPPSPEDVAAKLLEDLDADGDGALSTDEISASEHPRLAELAEVADTDGDGLLSESEIVAHGEERAKAFADRSSFPPPGLERPPEIDYSALLNSASSGSSAYESNSLLYSLLEDSASLNLAV